MAAANDHRATVSGLSGGVDNPVCHGHMVSGAHRPSRRHAGRPGQSCIWAGRARGTGPDRRHGQPGQPDGARGRSARGRCTRRDRCRAGRSGDGVEERTDRAAAERPGW